MSSGLVVWFTGLSGSGKSTIAEIAADKLSNRGFLAKVVDGDEIRRTVARHLGFSPEDVMESNRVAIRMCSDLRQGCDVVLVSRVSPFRSARSVARKAIGQGFVEVYVKASLEAVSSRDPKGLYERAKKGETGPLIGMPEGVPFETPDNPEILLDTESFDQHTLAERLVGYVESRLVSRQSSDNEPKSSTTLPPTAGGPR